MENTTTTTKTSSRGAAISALAVVGFIVLIIIGIVLAIYTARRMPKVASKLNGASVSLSSIFNKNEDKPALQVVAASSTLPFGATASTTAASSTGTAAPDKATPAATHSSGTGASYAGQTTYTTVVTSQPVALYGTPDLAVNVTDVGYLSRGGDTSSFIGSNSVPFGNNAAIRFTIRNTGTNVSGPWNFSAEIPTSPSQHFVAPMQASLNPGESADFVLGFDRGYSSGQQITLTVIADPSNYIHETTKNNNVSSRWLIIQ